ncbi:MAG: DUF975 family protein [Oscillospiraceae bacterium]|nr:DUF975 family protein [Oscillospiraceae bacterium]
MLYLALKAESRKLMKKNAPMLFVVCIIYIAIISVLSELSFRFSGSSKMLSSLLSLVEKNEPPMLDILYSNISTFGVTIAAIVLLVNKIIEVGFMQYCMKISRAQSADYKNLVDGFFFFTKTLLIWIISSFFVFLWSLLLIVPGVIASYRYSQAYYILLDAPEKSALQCIRESKQITHGKKLDLFLLNLSFFGWLALHVLVTMLLPLPFTVPIVLVWLTPYQSLAQVAFYNRLINYNHQDNSIEA